MRHGLVGADGLDSLSDPAGGGSTSVTRERDGDHDAGRWCEELGEFIQASAPASRAARAAADAWAATSLEVRSRITGHLDQMQRAMQRDTTTFAAVPSSTSIPTTDEPFRGWD